MVAIILLTTMLSACLSYQRQGDHAFDEGNCAEALNFYDQAADAGTKDPEMFRRAAQCALDGGDFATAERYYSQALRFGAGLEVARELADFYVKTSNYASAVRVYQYLLRRASDKQSLYNNLGTALMYAGHHFDAESYLMIAQQMNPEDPTPYLNLGVLYDRHLRQPWLAIGFYECFAKLRGNAEENERVVQRTNELRSKWSRLYEPGLVTCGEAYHARPSRPVANLEEELKIPGEEEIGDGGETVTDGGETVTDGGETVTDGGEEPTTRPIEVETMVSKEDSPPDSPRRKPEGDQKSDAEATLEKARKSFDDQRWADTVAHLTSVPLARLGPPQRRMLGLSYLRQSNWAQASHWLELALDDGNSTDVVDGLLLAYRRTNEWNRVAALCKKFGNQPEYAKITAQRCRMPTTERENE